MFQVKTYFDFCRTKQSTEPEPSLMKENSNIARCYEDKDSKEDINTTTNVNQQQKISQQASVAVDTNSFISTSSPSNKTKQHCLGSFNS
jgi:hypothetical protein